MRLEIHYRIGQKVCGELKELGLYVNEKLFHLGNFYPDLIQSYLWCKHEYRYSREYIGKKIEKLKKQPLFFSFHLGILTHYICDYFCYPHSGVYDKNVYHHIMYELNQKVPKELYKTKLTIKSFTIEELGKFVSWYERIRPFEDNDDSDFHIAAAVATNFLQAAY
jgi:hypothetical protein